MWQVLQKALVASGALDTLVRGLESHGGSHPKLAVFCFAALSFVASDHSPHKLPGTAMSAYLAVMAAWRLDSEVQQYGCLALSYATAGERGRDNCRSLVAARGLGAMGSAMEMHRDSPDVARWAITALGNAAEALLVRHGGDDSQGGLEAACLAPDDPEGDSELYLRLCSGVEQAQQIHGNKKVSKAAERCRALMQL